MMEQYRTQTILALFHVGTILVGTIGIGAVLKTSGFSEGQEMSRLAIAVRNWGFALVMVPVAWDFVTIRMEIHRWWHSKRITLVSGLLLWAALAWFFLHVAARANSILVRMGNH